MRTVCREIARSESTGETRDNARPRRWLHAKHGYRRSASANQTQCRRYLRCELALSSSSNECLVQAGRSNHAAANLCFVVDGSRRIIDVPLLERYAAVVGPA